MMTAVGGMLGRYEVMKHLAQGGMAEVLLARSSGVSGFERYVVIKRIRGDQSRDEQFVKMFLDEARLAAALHHNNILQVHDIGEEAGEYFFTMEYLHGQDLRKLLRRCVDREELVPLEQVVMIVASAAAGLHFAHEHRGPDRQPLGIVHRDVSLSNIMVGYDGFVKVTDFGIAKAAMRSAETRSGVLKGKVAYMSPEQCLGKPVDRRSDVYALGIVLYELATARRLFKADSDFLTMSAIVDGNIPPPTTLRPEISPALEAIILKALARRPANRYQTADELRAALEDHAVASHMRLSGTALASYMKKLFGDQPEPWVVDAPIDVPDDSDFDGSQSGVVDPNSDALRELALPADAPEVSPIGRARVRATTSAPVFQAPEKREDEPSTTVDAEPSRDNAAELPAAASRVKWFAAASRVKWFALAAVLAAAAAVVIVIATRGGSTPERTPEPTPVTTNPPPAPTPQPKAAVDPKPAPDPPELPPTETPTPTPPPVAVGSGSAAKRPVTRPPPRRPANNPPKKDPPPKWDPDELLPK
jgi:serine/threonine protein kinase